MTTQPQTPNPAPLRSRDLTGLVVVVTGGNTGIGLGLARGVARAGASVAVWGRNAEKNEDAVGVLAELGAPASSHICDVGLEDEVESAMEDTLRRHGKVDCLFANAGVYSGCAFVDCTLDEWRRITQVNLDGAFLTMRAVARHLIGRGEGGSLVGVSSTAAIHGAPRMTHYSATKAAITAMTRSLAVELARYGVRCNSLIPGWTDTDMLGRAKSNEKFVAATISRTPVRRWATPEDFGEIASFLADPRIVFHTGDTLVFDGGYTIF